MKIRLLFSIIILSLCVVSCYEEHTFPCRVNDCGIECPNKSVTLYCDQHSMFSCGFGEENKTPRIEIYEGYGFDKIVYTVRGIGVCIGTTYVVSYIIQGNEIWHRGITDFVAYIIRGDKIYDSTGNNIVYIIRGEGIYDETGNNRVYTIRRINR